MRSKRFEVLDARPVNQDSYVTEWPEVGLIAMDGPNDPKPSIKIVNGEIVELDTAAHIWTNPRDEYTKTLLASFPRLTGERGVVVR